MDIGNPWETKHTQKSATITVYLYHLVSISMCFSAISLDHLDLEDEDPDFEDLVQTSVLSEIIGKVWKVIV
jgi:hypothetical protein